MEKLIYEVGDYVRGLFKCHPRPNLFYHNLAHTESVVNHAIEIGFHYRLPEQDQTELIVAAWFHDTGYLISEETNNHEERGIGLMRKFMASRNIAEKVLENIAACILATKIPSAPVSLIEKILCDADCYHLGTSEFIKKDALVWRELEAKLHRNIKDQLTKTIHFLTNHEYFTSYCRQILTEGKCSNIELLEKLVKQV